MNNNEKNEGYTAFNCFHSVRVTSRLQIKGLILINTGALSQVTDESTMLRVHDLIYFFEVAMKSKCFWSSKDTKLNQPSLTSK